MWRVLFFNELSKRIFNKYKHLSYSFSLKLKISEYFKLRKKEFLEDWLLTRFTWPRAIFISSVFYSPVVVKETSSFNIPSIGIVDTNTRSQAINLPIPGNDESIEAIIFYNETISDWILLAKFSFIFMWFTNVRSRQRLVDFKNWFENSAMQNLSQLWNSSKKQFKHEYLNNTLFFKYGLKLKKLEKKKLKKIKSVFIFNSKTSNSIENLDMLSFFDENKDVFVNLMKVYSLRTFFSNLTFVNLKKSNGSAFWTANVLSKFFSKFYKNIDTFLVKGYLIRKLSLENFLGNFQEENFLGNLFFYYFYYRFGIHTNWNWLDLNADLISIKPKEEGFFKLKNLLLKNINTKSNENEIFTYHQNFYHLFNKIYIISLFNKINLFLPSPTFSFSTASIFSQEKVNSNFIFEKEVMLKKKFNMSSLNWNLGLLQFVKQEQEQEELLKTNDLEIHPDLIQFNRVNYKNQKTFFKKYQVISNYNIYKTNEDSN